MTDRTALSRFLTTAAQEIAALDLGGSRHACMLQHQPPQRRPTGARIHVIGPRRHAIDAGFNRGRIIGNPGCDHPVLERQKRDKWREHVDGLGKILPRDGQQVWGHAQIGQRGKGQGWITLAGRQVRAGAAGRADQQPQRQGLAVERGAAQHDLAQAVIGHHGKPGTILGQSRPALDDHQKIIGGAGFAGVHHTADQVIGDNLIAPQIAPHLGAGQTGGSDAHGLNVTHADILGGDGVQAAEQVFPFDRQQKPSSLTRSVQVVSADGLLQERACDPICTGEGGGAWSGAFLPRMNRVQVAGELLFRLEGQCLNRRAVGPLIDELQRRWGRECAGLTPDGLAFGLEALGDAMPMLNSIRAQVVAEGVA